MKLAEAEQIRDGNGWHMTLNARKAHYYGADSRSLCGKWFLLFGPAKSTMDSFDSPYSKLDCKSCRTKVDKAHEILGEE